MNPNSRILENDDNELANEFIIEVRDSVIKYTGKLSLAEMVGNLTFISQAMIDTSLKQQAKKKEERNKFIKKLKE